MLFPRNYKYLILILKTCVYGVAAGGGGPDVFGVEDAHSTAREHILAGQRSFERAGVVNFLIVQRDGNVFLAHRKKAVEQVGGCFSLAAADEVEVAASVEFRSTVFSALVAVTTETGSPVTVV